MTAYLLPVPKQAWRDANGLPLVAGTVETYIPGTLTLKDCWQDSGQVTLNTHPIVLDARGEAIMWGNGAYRIIVKDALGNLIYDQIADVTTIKGDPGAQGLSAPGQFIVTGADATGGTDSAALIQAQINAAGAASGGTVSLPQGDFLIRSTLNMNISGVKFDGVGHGGLHDVNPLVPAPTRLIWGGANGGTMIAAAATAGGPKLTDVAVTGMALVSGVYPYSTAAAIGLLISSVQNSEFDITTDEFTEAAIAMTVTAGLTEANNNEGNRISQDFRQINTAGTALQLGGNTVANTCHNTFRKVRGYINNGIGIDFQDCDNNRLQTVWIDRITGGSGVNLFYRGAGGPRAGNAPGLGGGRTNIIAQFSQSVHSGLIYSEGTETVGVTSPAYGNRIDVFDNANAAITSSVGAGASFYWSGNLNPIGMREAVNNASDGRRQLSDGTILFWGSSAGQFGAGQLNGITLPFGCSRILSVSPSYVGDGAAPSWGGPVNGNTFQLFSNATGYHHWYGVALA